MADKRRKRATDYLLIDVSNSFCKIAYSTTTNLSPALRVATADLARIHLLELFRKREVRKVVIASVVPDKTAQIQKWVGTTRVLAIDHRANLGVGISYPQPQTIGADRLANAAAVAELYGVPSIVVDFGTAVTFDVISAAREYVGGVIAPGLEVMTSYLHQRTALLPRITLREPRTVIGKSTRNAMLAGAVFGYRGLIREIIDRIRKETSSKRRTKIVATGGYAQLIASQLPAIDTVHPNLTLEGLRIIANLNP